MRNWRGLLLPIGAALLLASCAAGINTNVDVPAPDGTLAGFWLGLWHGIILPIAFIISLFTDNVSIYEVHNSGGWYDFGFVFGALISLGGSGGGGTARMRRRERHAAARDRDHHHRPPPEGM